MRGLIAAVVLLLGTHIASAQDHTHPAQDQQLHNKFYSNWLRPIDRDKNGDRVTSCCGGHDCYPTEVLLLNGQLAYFHRETAKWRPVQKELLEHLQRDPRESPDGRSHVCASAAGTLFCIVLGSGT